MTQGLRTRRALILPVFVLLALAGCGEQSAADASSGDGTSFEVDPFWPQPLPENQVFGPITGIHVDSRGHVWVAHAPSMLDAGHLGAEQDPPIAECCVAAARVVEFDAAGHLLQGWDVESDEYAWSPVPHGLFVDHNDFVWIGSRELHQVLKFTRDGTFVLAIGEEGVTGGSNHTSLLGSPAGIWVDPETNEAFIADGYRNRRVLVVNGETGEYIRHWGAYGEVPDDEVPSRPDNPENPPSTQFLTVHQINGSNDGLIYVADRRNNRVQVFRQDGEFVDEVFFRRGTLSSGSAFDIGFSPDAEQTFLYMLDGTNHKVWIVRRATLEIVGELGRGGTPVGQFYRPHVMAVGLDGSLYVGEADNARVQRFVTR